MTILLEIALILVFAGGAFFAGRSHEAAATLAEAQGRARCEMRLEQTRQLVAVDEMALDLCRSVMEACTEHGDAGASRLGDEVAAPAAAPDGTEL